MENPIPDIEDTSGENSPIKIKGQIFETQSKIYNDDEISIMVEILGKDENNRTKLKIVTKNNTNDSIIENVTYFLNILKNDEIIISDFFFVEGDTFLLNVYQNDSNFVEISGERQYDHNAIIATSNPPI